MKFRLKTNKDNYYYYDNETNILTDEQGNNVVKKGIPKDVALNRVCVQLGFSCNFSCEYCLQSKNKKKKHNEDEINTLVEKLLLLNLEESRVEFWGGEPLLYLDEIKAVVELTKHRVKQYQIITNGSLLTMEVVKYLVKNNFIIVLSHDCQEQHIRGVEVLDKHNEVFRWLVDNYKDKFCINSVLHGKNIITSDRLDFLESKLGTRDFLHSGEGPIYNSHYNNYDDNLENIIAKDIIVGEGLHYGFYSGAIKAFINVLYNQTPMEKTTTKCGIDRNSYTILSIDELDLTCHNYDTKMDISLLQSRNKCKNCMVSNLCKGSCPIIDENSEQFEKNCAIMKKTYRAIFRAAFYLLLDEQIKEIDEI